MKIIGKHKNATDQFKFWLLSVVWLFDNLVCVLTLGFLVPDWHTPLLFSDWMDPYEQ